MKPKKETTVLKKVKIDEHIKSTKKSNSSASTGKRGRPRKNTEQLHDAGKINLGGDSSSSVTLSESVETHIGDNQPASIEPVYDTTEEAKGFLRAPFDIAAGLTGIQKLALYPAQLDALAPSFKIVYDKRIAPKLGEDADLIAFAIVASGVIFEKVSVWREAKALEEPKVVKHTDTAGTPFIPSEHHV
jgi:hypothetical protein